MIADLQELESAHILVIDDEKINLEILKELLASEQFLNITLFSDPEKAIRHYQHNPPDIVLLDLSMPNLSGFDVMQRFNDINHIPKPPVIIITAHTDRKIRLQALDNDARDFISKPFDNPEVISRINNLLEMHLAHKENLQYTNNLETIIGQRTQELLNTQREMIERLGLAAEYKDNETAAHTIRVGHYAQLLGLGLGLNHKEAEQLKLAAPMHDLGKIGIPDSVLLKPGKLDADEWTIMKKHAEIGYAILKDSKSLILKNAGIIALAHHEKWDGSGYPSGLKGSDIHLYGRITAIADVFDALTMDRPYKKAWTVEDAVDLINSESGKHFDPSIVEVFNQVLDQFLEIKVKYAD